MSDMSLSEARVKKVRYEPEGYESLKLTDILGIMVNNGYRLEVNACTGLNRETWRCVPPGLSAEEADRVRAGHPIWSRIINMRFRKWGEMPATRLSWAALAGNLARVRELCEWGADIEAADEFGCTPLYCASYNGHLDVVRELLARGANIEATTNDGYTSLLIASQEGYLDVVRELLARGANIEAATDDGATSLWGASQDGHLDVVRELLARGAVVDAITKDGCTPYITASYHGYTEVVGALLAYGANEHVINNFAENADCECCRPRHYYGRGM